MADDADSKSVGRKPVWVQVPLPALFAKPRKSKIFSKIKGLRVFSLLTIFLHKKTGGIAAAQSDYSFTEFGCHQGIELCIPRHLVYERHQRSTDLDKSVPCIHIRDISHL